MINSLFDVLPPVKPLPPEQYRAALPPLHTKRGKAENTLKMIKAAVEKEAQQ